MGAPTDRARREERWDKIGEHSYASTTYLYLSEEQRIIYYYYKARLDNTM